MNSFALLRTNTGLTSNVKIIVSSDYKLYLESFDSTPELSISKYKKFQFNKNNYYDELVPYFFEKTSVDVAFSIKYDDDNDKMFNDFSKQYDDIYQMGCRNISSNKDYSEEFECLAPIYIFSHHVPKYFIILRVDGPGLHTLDKSNFRTEILNNFKCVKLFDLTKSTPLGEWIENNFTKNISYPETPFELDFRKLEFSKWNGIDFETGGYSSKSFFMDETLENENIFFDLNKTVFDGYKNNKIVFPNILNFSFLFDDTPATPTSLRKWSINRYYGFYLEDIELEFCVSPYIPPTLKNDIIIDNGNILRSLSSNNPFEKDFKSDQSYYVEYMGKFYKVESFIEKSIPRRVFSRSNNVINETMSVVDITKYRIISDIDLSGKQSELNKKIIIIDPDNKISLIDGSPFIIDNYDFADLWLINIDGVNHVIRKNSYGEFFIQTDYGFQVSIDKFSYYINDPDPSFRKDISLIVDSNNPPKNFKISKVKFSDIKDFDTQIVNTEYSKFEYDIDSVLTNTDETKMYTTDLRSSANPRDLNDYKLNNEVVNIPCTSEFIATGEIFEIEKGESNGSLSPIWRKNPIFCKWGFQNSLSANDYPYYMNNSSYGEDYNRTTNPFFPQPSRIERNLDYFYTINAGTTSYSHQTLNINGENFDLNKYLGFESVGTYSYNYDYFSYFFGKKAFFDNGLTIKNTTKYSYLNKGGSVIPNTTIFRGLKFKVYDVSTTNPRLNSLDNLILNASNNYEDYKLSILLNENDYMFNYDSVETNRIIGLTAINNTMNWKIIDEWKLDQTYVSDIVLYNDVLYTSSSDSLIIDPNVNPANSPNWMLLTTNPGDYPFWSPNVLYSPGQWVYNNGEYYVRNSSVSSIDFWTPEITYGSGSYSIYQDYVWKSMTSSNSKQPSTTLMPGGVQQYWTKTFPVSATSSKWDLVKLWNPSDTYLTNDYVVHNYILYGASQSSSGEDPTNNSDFWTKQFSIVPDTNFIYNSGSVYSSSNNMVMINNRYYLCISNTTSSTLDNGINIYVNKKWKNILINIYINDNTSPDISGTTRDMMYTDLNSKLTATNFINAINDITNKYGFSDSVRYIIINEDGSIRSYDINNIKNIPTMLVVEHPDEFNIKIDSLAINQSTINKNLIKPIKTLNKGAILSLSQINYYNDIPLGTDISRVNKERMIIDNYSGLKNEVYNNLYRHSGYYMPIFYEIELFKRPDVYGPLGIGNYKFDTDLTFFGIIKERVLSKINRKGTILKLRNNSSLKSIYPMLDEYGYTTVNFFIFKSNWDFEYYYECVEAPAIDVTVQTTNITSINNTL